MDSIQPIVTVPPNVIDKKMMARLKRAGYLVVEIADPSSLRVLPTFPVVPVDLMAKIAVEVISDEKLANYQVRDEFQRRVLKALAAATKK
jgi:hypothetical protein